MKYLLGILILATAMNTQIVFNFSKHSNIRDWTIVDDVVMGGKSSSRFTLSQDGFGLFEGQVSLDNNGGFSSVRYQFKKINVSESSKIIIKIKGDGKNYQLRIKHNSSNYYSYIMPFATSGEWQEVEIPLKDMYPSFRGRRLNLPNFRHDYIEEVVFLIGNNKPEKFRLLIDEIALK